MNENQSRDTKRDYIILCFKRIPKKEERKEKNKTKHGLKPHVTRLGTKIRMQYGYTHERNADSVFFLKSIFLFFFLGVFLSLPTLFTCFFYKALHWRPQTNEHRIDMKNV